jgi:integrase
MGRPPLPIGTYGKIRTYETAQGWRAVTNFRDFDGRTRPVERIGATEPAAKRNLKVALRDRAVPSSGEGLTRDSRFRVAAEMWLDEFQSAVDAGDRSVTSKETYEQRLQALILPAIGELRLHECSVPRLTALCRTVQRRLSASTARTVRTVLSGVCGLAVRHGALPSNPVRDIPRLEGRKIPSRALSLSDLTELLGLLDHDEIARDRDLPDLIRWYVGTGERTGEGLAVQWDQLNLETGTAQWGGGVVRVKGQGQRINQGKTEVSARTLNLPAWLTEMLRDRRAKMATLHGVQPADLNGPVFPNSLGGLRDKHNTLAQWRAFRAETPYSWVTIRTFRRSVATILDAAGLSARQIADQLGQSKISTTQDVYMGRRAPGRAAADALEVIRPSAPKSEGKAWGRS